jgi:hypothetical protein
MYAPFSSNDIDTFVSPMRGTAVAMPAASRCSARKALAVLLERLSIVEDDDDGKLFEWNRIQPNLFKFIRS